MHRVLVCGGRDFADRVFAFAALDRFRTKFGVSVIIHGAAKGADSLAAEWAVSRGIETIAFPADWEARGRAAGPIRNQKMIDEGHPTAIVALPGGKGTADMCKRGKAHGIPVYRPSD